MTDAVAALEAELDCLRIQLAKVRRNGEAQRYVGREGICETHVRAQSSSISLCQRLNVILTRWLIKISRNPYRPELHYMRGPGPKWYAKHRRTALASANKLLAENNMVPSEGRT